MTELLLFIILGIRTRNPPNPRLRCTGQLSESTFLSKIVRAVDRTWKCGIKSSELEIKRAGKNLFFIPTFCAVTYPDFFVSNKGEKMFFNIT